MKKIILALSLIAVGVASAQASSLKVTTGKNNLENELLKHKYVYCKSDDVSIIAQGGNISPSISWSKQPKNTKSFVLLLSDPDIPDSPNFNVPGLRVKKIGTPRITAYHWVLANIPANITSLPEGAGSKSFVIGGKAPGKNKYGLAGINVYSGVFKSPIASRIEFDQSQSSGYKKEKIGYGGYDGPCPPFNDEKLHNYTITVYALDIKELKLPASGNFTGDDVVKAMKGHVLDKGSLVVPYTNTPKLIQYYKEKNKSWF